MTYGTSADSSAVRMIPIVMPGPATPSLGEWHARGLCVGADPETFFPTHGGPGTEALQNCAGCGVREDCLKYATEADGSASGPGLTSSSGEPCARSSTAARSPPGPGPASLAALGGS